VREEDLGAVHHADVDPPYLPLGQQVGHGADAVGVTEGPREDVAEAGGHGHERDP
jgi:hypothetical protein